MFGIFGKSRFYCTECKKFIDRRMVKLDQVEYIPEDPYYYCKWCGSPVLKTRKLLEDVCEDYIDYLQKHNYNLEDFM